MAFSTQKIGTKVWGERYVMILNRDNLEDAREVLARTLRMCLEFKIRDRVYDQILDKPWKYADIPTEGTTLSGLLDYFERLLPYCANFSSTQFMGFPDSGNSVAAMIGAIFGELLQQNLINHSFCSPIATHLEIETIRWLRQVVGYPVHNVKDIYDIGGVITSSGTMSNAVAMMLIRENRSYPKTKVVVPENIGHYSIASSLFWIGNTLECLTVPTRHNKYDKVALEQTLRQNKSTIAAVVSYACDSRSMSVEDLRSIHALVKGVDDSIWLHVDACHGFSLGFSERLREMIAGIEEHDSISTDPHKVLMTPYVISALLLKDSREISKVMSKSDLIMQEPLALGQTTPFLGSKNWNSLKLWFLIKNLGKDELGRIVERRFELIQYMYHRALESGEFLVLNRPEYNSLMFMYCGSCARTDVQRLNHMNRGIYRHILDQGDYYIHQFPFMDTDGAVCKNEVVYPLRLIAANPNLHESDLDILFDYIVGIGQDMEREISNE